MEKQPQTPDQTAADSPPSSLGPHLEAAQARLSGVHEQPAPETTKPRKIPTTFRERYMAGCILDKHEIVAAADEAIADEQTSPSDRDYAGYIRAVCLADLERDKICDEVREEYDEAAAALPQVQAYRKASVAYRQACETHDVARRAYDEALRPLNEMVTMLEREAWSANRLARKQARQDYNQPASPGVPKGGSSKTFLRHDH